MHAAWKVEATISLKILSKLQIKPAIRIYKNRLWENNAKTINREITCENLNWI
jgi:hypothetical protein